MPMSRTVCRCRARWASFFSTWPGHWPTLISPGSLSFSSWCPPPPVSLFHPPRRWLARRLRHRRQPGFPTSPIADRSSWLRYLHHKRPPPLFVRRPPPPIPVRRRRLWLSHAIPAHAVARGATHNQTGTIQLTNRMDERCAEEIGIRIAWKVQSNRFAGCGSAISVIDCLSTPFQRTLALFRTTLEIRITPADATRARTHHPYYCDQCTDVSVSAGRTRFPCVNVRSVHVVFLCCWLVWKFQFDQRVEALPVDWCTIAEARNADEGKGSGGSSVTKCDA